MTGNPINLKILLESQTLQRAPFPVPVGWYHVDFSDMLKPGEMRNIQLFGQEWVLFRTEGGKPGVSSAHLNSLHGAQGIPPAVCEFKDHIFSVNMANGYIIGKAYGAGLNVFHFTQEGITSTMISYTQPISADKSQMNMSFRHKD